MIIIIYTDGAARGNPGPASLGVVIQADKEHQYRQYLGIATNNQAEYKALIFALKKVHQLIQEQNLEVDKIVCYSDSELLVRQMKSEYKVKNRSLAPLFAKAWNLAQQFKTVVFMRIPREENQTADKLANKAIDQHLKSDY